MFSSTSRAPFFTLLSQIQGEAGKRGFRGEVADVSWQPFVEGLVLQGGRFRFVQVKMQKAC